MDSRIPSPEEGVVQLTSDVVNHLGLGANFAVRRAMWPAVGWFDPWLGAGTRFAAAEDTDFGYRALHRGLVVSVAQGPTVIHYGLRRPHEIPAATGQYLRGMAAMCLKHVRCGDVQMLGPVLREFHALAGQGSRLLLQAKRPSGYRGTASLLAGAVGSFRYDVDRARRLYCLRGRRR